MSNFQALAFNPVTRSVQVATYLDNYFGKHGYGVQFSKDHVVPLLDVVGVSKSKNGDYSFYYKGYGGTLSFLSASGSFRGALLADEKFEYTASTLDEGCEAFLCALDKYIKSQDENVHG